jgi:hypothetical protein
MNLEGWAYAATIGQFVLVAISLFAIWYQLPQTTMLSRAANSQALAEHAGSFNSLLIQDSEVARIWYSYGQGLDREEFEAIAAIERYREMLVQWLIIHENIFYQNRERLLDRGIYESWCRDLERTVKQHNLRVFDSKLDELFSNQFGEYLVKLQTKGVRPGP